MLHQAALHALQADVGVDAVCCAPDDAALPSPRRSELPLVSVLDPATDQLPVLARCRDGPAFSINNRHFLDGPVRTHGARADRTRQSGALRGFDSRVCCTSSPPNAVPAPAA